MLQLPLLLSLSDSASGTCLILGGNFQRLNSTTGVMELWMNAPSGGLPLITTTYNESLTGPPCGGIQPVVSGTNLSKAYEVIFRKSKPELEASIEIF